MIVAFRGKKRPQNICLNMDCITKKLDESELKGKLGKPCPRCKDGKLDIKKSLYGWFVGCSTYPKCRYTEKVALASGEEAIPLDEIGEEGQGQAQVQSENQEDSE